MIHSIVTKVRVINLKRRYDKLLAFHGAAQSRDVKPKDIEPFEAHDAQDYESPYSIREAASAQFPFWSKLSDQWIKDGYLGKGSLCCLWSMQCVLELIGQEESGTDLTLMITDHYYLRCFLWELNDKLMNFNDMDILQLHHWTSYKKDFDYPPTFPTPILSMPYISMKNFPEFSCGLAGLGDTAIVLSPEGARRVLGWCEEMPYHLLERLFYVKSFTEYDKCFSSIIPSQWVAGPIELEALTGNPNSERLTGDGRLDSLTN